MRTPKKGYPLSDARYTGCSCPACGSEDITNDGSEYSDHEQMTFNVSCNECNAYWQELYLVAGYTDLHYGLTDEEVPHEEQEVIAYRDLLKQRDELRAAMEAILKMDETSTGEGLWIHGGNNRDLNELESRLERARKAIAQCDPVTT